MLFHGTQKVKETTFLPRGNPSENSGAGRRMRKELFDDLVESVKEGMAILREKRNPHGSSWSKKKQDVKSIRSKFGISQREFASLLGISVPHS